MVGISLSGHIGSTYQSVKFSSRDHVGGIWFVDHQPFCTEPLTEVDLPVEILEERLALHRAANCHNFRQVPGGTRRATLGVSVSWVPVTWWLGGQSPINEASRCAGIVDRGMRMDHNIAVPCF